jgi:rubrerythrin
VLIYENIDAPKNTVRPSVAIDRLENPEIGNMTFAASEKARIQRAVELRNRITHSEFELKPEYAAAKFFELFAFVVYFQGHYLDTEIEAIVSEDHMAQLISIEKALEELYEKALKRIEEEGIDSALVWACPDCSHDTFVIKDGIDTCYTCRHREPVIECPYCESLFFEWQMKSFSEDLDTDYDEGRTVIHNNYGYSHHSACADCLPNIKDDIQRKRDKDDYYRAMEEYYYRKG